MMPKDAELLRQLMDNMTDNIFFKDLNSRFIMMNKACAQWDGFNSPHDAVGKSDFDLFTPEFAQAAREDELHIFASGQALTCKEEHAEWEDGHMKWISTTKVPLRNPEGKIKGCIGIGRDITALKHKEAELEATSEMLRQSNQQLQLMNEQMAEDLQMAARLQQAFLPQNYPVFLSEQNQSLIDFHYFYESDSAIGGDYCAIHRLDDHRAGLLICDAIGHGVRAALITGIIRALFDNITREPRSAGEFLTSLNHQLYPLLQSEDAFLFATACCLIIDLRSSELSGAIAGHPIPFLIRPEQELVSPLPVDESYLGPALAIHKEFSYDTFSLPLTQGDKVVMVTDGIFEAVNESGEELGMPQLQQILFQHRDLPLKDLFPRIIQSAREHTQQQKLGDDACILGLSLNTLSLEPKHHFIL
ncbi:SpoIIE family protein phosphatase [Kiritimatiellota bacterium B12222]|nr:SpoIIE family protein phosphatase [Kiritimatiellota bacterium B12222]